MRYEEVVRRVNTLPPLTDTAHIIKKLYSRGYQHLNIDKLVSAIESDAVLCATVLRSANSAIYGFRRKINSISQAISLLGAQIIYGLVLEYCVGQKIQANLLPYGISSGSFNSMCKLQSLLVKEWYGGIDEEISSYLTPLAHIMEIGKIVLSSQVIKHGDEVSFFNQIDSTNDIEKFEHSYCETTSYFISSLLLDHWQFDYKYVEILRGLDFELDNDLLENYINILDIVRVAINVKDQLTKESIYRATAIVDELGLDTQKFNDILLGLRKKLL